MEGKCLIQALNKICLATAATLTNSAQRDNIKVSDDEHARSIHIFKDEAAVVLKLGARLKGGIGRTDWTNSNYKLQKGSF